MIVGMFIEMYGDTCVVAPHLGSLDEVVCMRGHNLCLSGDVKSNTPNCY